MRKKIYEGSREAALDLFRQAEVVRIATTTGDGRPVLRTVHGVVARGYVAFHGAPAGEKMESLGREAVVQAEEIVAEMPSTFLDPERACAATTWYLSAQTSGPIEEVEDPEEKALILDLLMARLQPEGGYVGIAAEHALYRNAVRGTAVLRVSLERAIAKTKLGQNRSPEELGRVLDALWRRGRPGDPRAIELALAANPAAATPAFLEAPGGVELVCSPGERHVEGAVGLLAGTYWNAGEDPARLARAQLGSTAWVVAVEVATGGVVGTARAVSDGARRAWIYDVAVGSAWRGRGIGKAVLRLLLDHPRVRDVRFVNLSTVDAQEFYRPFGFVERQVGMNPESVVMLLERAAVS